MTGTAQLGEKKGSPRVTDRPVAVSLNGTRRDVPNASSIADLLAALSLDARGVVVEHNGSILRNRDSLPSVILAEGDVIEIVHFVGGG